jgi:hypothetical protein
MRGGYRPGSGRKKGTKDSKPRGTPKRDYHDNEAAKRKELLALGDKAKLKFYQDFMKRVAAGDTLTLAEMKFLDKLKADLEVDEKKTPASEDLEAEEYLRKVWNDPNIDHALRIKAAEVVCKGPEKKGKKDEKADRARVAGTGKFKAGRAPLSVVK